MNVQSEGAQIKVCRHTGSNPSLSERILLNMLYYVRPAHPDRSQTQTRGTKTMVMTKPKPKTKLLTADDLLRLYSEGVRGELIRGVLHETMAKGEEHGFIVMNICILVGGFVKPRRLGRVVGSDSGVQLEWNPDTVREPDVAFISAEKRPLDVRNMGYTQVPPDLVVEVISPSDRLSEVIDKALMWLSFGVGVVWLVDPESRTVTLYRDDAPAITLGEDDTLDAEPVLPGFTCSVREIFEV